MKKKWSLKLNKLSKELNYYDVQFDFYKGDRTILNYDELFERGMYEDDFPWTIDEFKKLGYGFSKAVYECSDKERMVYYEFNELENHIIIKSDNFTIKEFIIIVNMIQAQQCGKWLYQVGIGNSNEDTYTKYGQETTSFGMWWEDFYNMYMDNLKKDIIDKILICMEENTMIIIFVEK